MHIKKIKYSSGDWASIISLVIVLVAFVYQTGFTKVYKYTEKSEICLNKLHTDSNFVDKIKPLIGQEHFSEERFKSAIDSLAQIPIDGKLLDLIVESSDQHISFKKHIDVLECFLIVVGFFALAFFIRSAAARTLAIQAEVETFKEEVKTLKSTCEEKEIENGELTIKNQQLSLQNEKDAEYKHHLCMCNVVNAFHTLKDSKWDISNTRENAANLHEFHMIAIFAEKWLGDENNLSKFIEFMDTYKNSDYRRPENDKILFLLSDPLNDSVRERLIKSDANITNETIDACFNNYSELYKIYHRYDNLFECRIMDEFPIFRYRRINDEILVADYSLRVDAHGEHRPHLLLKNVDSLECDGEQIPANQFYDAFIKYFNACWSAAQPFPDYMKAKLPPSALNPQISSNPPAQSLLKE